MSETVMGAAVLAGMAGYWRLRNMGRIELYTALAKLLMVKVAGLKARRVAEESAKQLIVRLDNPF